MMERIKHPFRKDQNNLYYGHLSAGRRLKKEVLGYAIGTMLLAAAVGGGYFYPREGWPELPFLATPTASAAAGQTPEALPTPEERLKDLDVIFTEQGPKAWLEAAGFTFTSLELDARQPEETLLGNKIVATGFQVKVTDLNANWPAGLTTDQPVNGNCVKPDPNNLSKVCTNVRGFNGNATLYVDLQDWRQLAPK